MNVFVMSKNIDLDFVTSFGYDDEPEEVQGGHGSPRHDRRRARVDDIKGDDNLDSCQYVYSDSPYGHHTSHLSYRFVYHNFAFMTNSFI